MILHADLSLARRLERVEARMNANFVEARSVLSPETGATWREVAGAYLMFDGVGSPCTQSFGLGVFGEITPAEMDTAEQFFFDRGSAVFHEICPLADPGLLAMLADRGYRAIEVSNVLFRPLETDIAAPESVKARVVGPDELDLWAKVGAAGWSEHTELADQMFELGQVVARRANAASFLAEVNGVPIAAGALGLHDGVALLAGASTLPSARRQGAQLALLSARLRYAREHRCEFAMMVALPGSGSQRNAERHGFRVAYTRTKWTRGT